MMLKELWEKKEDKIDNRGIINSKIIFYYFLGVVNSKRIANCKKEFHITSF